MDRAVYDRMGAEEAEHWWFVGRRAVLDALVRRYCHLPPGARVLEAGCGTGGNLAMLAEYGRLEAFEYDDTARLAASAKGIVEAAPGALPDGVDLADGTYDLIALFDVLEHIEEDRASLETLGAKLSATGRIILSVPANPWLWSRHDEVHHHFRRYTSRSLRGAIEGAGLKAHALGKFNTLLFPAAVGQRLLQRVTGSESADDTMPPAWLNQLLMRIFVAERHLVGRIPMPFGLSLFAVIGR